MLTLSPLAEDSRSKSILKRPIALHKTAKRRCAPEAEHVEASQEANWKKKQRYQKMWYKRTHRIGLRRAFDGKEQFFSFGKKSVSEEDLRDLGDKALEKLH